MLTKSDQQMRLECIHVASKLLGTKAQTEELLRLADTLWEWVLDGDGKNRSARDLRTEQDEAHIGVNAALFGQR